MPGAIGKQKKGKKKTLLWAGKEEGSGQSWFHGGGTLTMR